MIPGIRTPVTGRGTGAGASRPQGSASPTRQGKEGPSGARQAQKGISLTYGATAPVTTPSPAGPSGQTLDAARTFIRRPERKRRSIDLMQLYEKQTDTFATLSSDKLLQDVMKTFEDIPAKVKDYPQMRKDIRTYLEIQSDRGLRAIFELSKRMKSLETATKTPPTSTPTSPQLQGGILERLEKVEAKLNTRLNDVEEKISKGIKFLADEYNENGADILDKVIDKVDEVGQKVDTVQACVDRTTEGVRAFGRCMVDLEDQINGVVGEVATRTDSLKEVIREAVVEPKTDPPTYASVTAVKPWRRPALHSMAVTLEGGQETADEVLARVKGAVDARGTGLKISKVRKAKNQTVILGCDTEEELQKVKERIESRGVGLTAAPMKNKNPLVVLKDVYLDSDDDELAKALYSQNDNIFRDLGTEEREMVIKYKKRTRNPKTVHVVVQVRPKVWQRMTEAGALYLDLQRVRVEDQSPLIQCTKCLAFGHGRKFCTESADRCSHCGGPHLREKCAEFLAGGEPQCCNCLHSKLQRSDHNAFSVECPVRRKWDYLARTTTAYA